MNSNPSGTQQPPTEDNYAVVQDVASSATYISGKNGDPCGGVLEFATMSGLAGYPWFSEVVKNRLTNSLRVIFLVEPSGRNAMYPFEYVNLAHFLKSIYSSQNHKPENTKTFICVAKNAVNPEKFRQVIQDFDGVAERRIDLDDQNTYSKTENKWTGQIKTFACQDVHDRTMMFLYKNGTVVEVVLDWGLASIANGFWRNPTIKGVFLYQKLKDPSIMLPTLKFSKEKLAENKNIYEEFIEEWRWTGTGSKYSVERVEEIGCVNRKVFFPSITAKKVQDRYDLFTHLWEGKKVASLSYKDPYSQQKSTYMNIANLAKRFNKWGEKEEAQAAEAAQEAQAAEAAQEAVKLSATLTANSLNKMEEEAIKKAFEPIKVNALASEHQHARILTINYCNVEKPGIILMGRALDAETIAFYPNQYLFDVTCYELKVEGPIRENKDEFVSAKLQTVRYKDRSVAKSVRIKNGRQDVLLYTIRGTNDVHLKSGKIVQGHVNAGKYVELPVHQEKGTSGVLSVVYMFTNNGVPDGEQLLPVGLHD